MFPPIWWPGPTYCVNLAKSSDTAVCSCSVSVVIDSFFHASIYCMRHHFNDVTKGLITQQMQKKVHISKIKHEFAS